MAQINDELPVTYTLGGRRPVSTPSHESMMTGKCSVCQNLKNCVVLTDILVCCDCDTRGRLAAARLAYKAYQDNRPEIPEVQVSRGD